ncbi:MAG: aminotransferase class I/II-fold pyridoxal phosphate-dependent enzyme [Gemmatimonadetes bacterium]|nr:aminotransferase class I/II-fold pyridoxal phosphate-dependent enzyme [Gemmatimonadota bacterium]
MPESLDRRMRRPSSSRLSLAPDEMRRLGYRVVDLLIERIAGLEQSSVWTGAARSETERLLREPAPEEGRAADEVLERAVRDVLAVAGRIDHPRFFAFVPSCPTWPSILGDFLAAGYNVFQGTWLESAGPSQVELVVTDWFRAWLGMPESAGGLLTSGGSAANLLALVTARESLAEPDAAGAGVLYLSDQGHGSLVRAARIMGIPPSRMRTVATDGSYRLDVRALAETLASDRSAGLTPLCVCANAGSTNTGSIDPLPEIADVCARERVWLHVDGAYGGFAALTAEGWRLLHGIERADSVALDPHKWLFQPYEAGCLIVRDARALGRAFRQGGDYLQDVQLGLEQVNFADRGLQLTRSFRALKVWISIQVLGLRAFREAVAEGMELARRAEAHIRNATHLELLAPASLGVVCYRYRDPVMALAEEELERLNERIQDEIVSSGYAMLSSTRLRGRYALRLCILNYHSTWDDVRGVLERVEETGRRLDAPLLGQRPG